MALETAWDKNSLFTCKTHVPHGNFLFVQWILHAHSNRAPMQQCSVMLMLWRLCVLPQHQGLCLMLPLLAYTRRALGCIICNLHNELTFTKWMRFFFFSAMAQPASTGTFIGHHQWKEKNKPKRKKKKKTLFKPGEFPENITVLVSGPGARPKCSKWLAEDLLQLLKFSTTYIICWYSVQGYRSACVCGKSISWGSIRLIEPAPTPQTQHTCGQGASVCLCCS